MNFLDTFSNNTYQSSLKSVLWKPSCSMLTDGQAALTNKTFACRGLLNEPKKTYVSGRLKVFNIYN